MENIIGKECKFVIYLPPIRNYRPDTHIIKEKIHFKDGTIKKNLKIVRNFKRPFWVTKEYYRNHKEKKESEFINKLNRHTATTEDLAKQVAARLGNQYVGVKDLRVVRDSPYVYGLDIDGKTFIKQAYQAKYPKTTSPNDIAVLDIETDTIKDEIIVISVTMKDKIYTVINKKLITNKYGDKSLAKLNEIYKDKLKYLYNKYIPDSDVKNIDVEYEIVKNDLDCVLKAIAKLHEWEPDIATVWNITYDINKILDTLEKYKVNPANVFSDPNVPKEYKYFKFKLGATSSMTESGKFKPISIEEQWHTIICPSKFYWIDAMSAHRYIRVGGKTIPGGYSLDNILKQELGNKLGKLKFKDEKSEHLGGLEWHLYMVAERPLEYIIYNQWDTMSMIELDNKTKDLQIVLDMLLGVSNYEIFNSGPKKIVNEMHFFYQERGRILGTKPSKVSDDKGLGLDSWIKYYYFRNIVQSLHTVMYVE